MVRSKICYFLLKTLTEKIIHLAKTITCNDLEAPLSNGNYSFWITTITPLKSKITFSLFTVILNCKRTSKK